MDYPKISIVTPCYNAEKYIEQTIVSILDQNYPNLEYIIIDGGSRDRTVEIIKKYEKQLSYWISETDKGQSDAINKGLQKCTGDVFNWINADDYLLPGALELVGKNFMNSECNILCTPTFFLHPDGSQSINGITNTKDEVNTLLNTRGLNQMGMYWKLAKIKQLGGVNTEFRYSMDLDLWKRYLLTFGKAYIQNSEQVTAVFRFHEESKTGIDLNDNLSVFELENNAALYMYARLIGQKDAEKMRFLYPKGDNKLAAIKPVAQLPVQAVKSWAHNLFYIKGQQYFFENKFKECFYLLYGVDKKLLPSSEQRNYSSYLRWSLLKRWF